LTTWIQINQMKESSFIGSIGVFIGRSFPSKGISLILSSHLTKSVSSKVFRISSQNMKAFLALVALVACVAAQDSQYGQPSHTPQTFKHVYVHSAPDEAPDNQSRTIRVPGGDKHVNIIFVKTPSSSSSHQTEVVLPEQDEHKNLVYVLLKKGESSSDVKVRRPAARGPQKPEVYFIKYGSPAAGYAGGAGGSGGSSSGGGGGGGSDGGIAPQPVRTQYGF